MKTMSSHSSKLYFIAMLCGCIWIAPGLLAHPETATECCGLSVRAIERIYLAAGYSDKDEKAAIGDPGEQPKIGDLDEQATIDDPDEEATIGDPEEKSEIGDPDEASGIGDPGEKKRF